MENKDLCPRKQNGVPTETKWKIKVIKQPPTYDATEDYYSYLGISPHASKEDIRINICVKCPSQR